jgi:hypothetical protein
MKVLNLSFNTDCSPVYFSIILQNRNKYVCERNNATILLMACQSVMNLVNCQDAIRRKEEERNSFRMLMSGLTVYIGAF